MHHRSFSRSMPSLEVEPWTLGAKVAVGALGAGAAALAVTFPPLAVGLAALYAVVSLTSRRRLAKMQAERPGDSICTFARAFDRRTVDPWIVRAVWDDLQTYVRTSDDDFPIRASDVIATDLSIDLEDIDDIANQVARRANRNMDNAESNPLYGSVQTVGDLVQFVNSQPVLGAA